MRIRKDSESHKNIIKLAPQVLGDEDPIVPLHLQHHISPVLEGELYVGSRRADIELEVLRRLNVTLVINITEESLNRYVLSSLFFGDYFCVGFNFLL